MSSSAKRRDYSLNGPENERAQEKGLVQVEWYATPIPRQRLKELMKRKDGPAIRDTIIWFFSLVCSGFLAYLSWGTWWSVPAFALYGVLWASPGDSRWHECGHGTAFKTPWMNEVVYHIASFMIFRPATSWRWSHSRHHTDTIIVGRDPEIVAPRPPVWRILLMEIFRLYAAPREIVRTVKHAFGTLDREERDYVPASERRKCYREARVVLLILVSVVAWSIYSKSILPLMFIGLPAFYGNFLVLLFGMSQHLGLKEDVLDHRLNTRTIYMNPILRFLYWNMNYHLEHHMFPTVPYHALPALHEAMKHDCPKPCSSLWTAFREIIPALVRQRKDPSYTIVRPLPETASPYKYGP